MGGKDAAAAGKIKVDWQLRRSDKRRRRLPCTYLQQYMYGRFCAAAASQTPDREKGRDPPTAAATPGTNNNNKHAPATAVKG